MSRRDSIEDDDKPLLNEREEGKVAEHRNLSSITVYAVVEAEGEEELARPVNSLFWSAIAAGVCISSSVLAEGILHVSFEDHPRRAAIENFGYTTGFILVILARLQLFTENTITVVLPLLKSWSRDVLWYAARLWGVVFAGNMIGTLFTAGVTLLVGTTPPEVTAGMLAVSAHFAELGPWEAFRYGIPAGFFIAAIVWMLPSSQGFEIFVIFIFTYLIAMGDFAHVVAGSTEMFLLLIDGQIGAAEAAALIAATFLGNVLGGTGLFALLAYGQVKNELDERSERSGHE